MATLTPIAVMPQKPKESVNKAVEFSQTKRQNKSIQQALEISTKYRKRNGLKAMVAIIQNHLVFGACFMLVQWISGMSHIPASATSILYVLSTFTIASRMRALENLVHEASHNNLFSSAQLHQSLQFMYAFPVFRIVPDYRRSHMIHHKYLGDRQKDPDIVRLYGLGLNHLPERPLWYLVGLPMTGFFTYEYLTTTFRDFWASSSCRFSKTIFWASVMLLVVQTSALRHFVYYYLVPLLVVLPITRYWAEASEHLGLDLRQYFGSSRTNIGFLHRWYMNPHNDGYHLVHHICGQIPFYLLPQAHNHLLKESGEFAEECVISYGIYETFRQMATRRTVVQNDVMGM